MTSSTPIIPVYRGLTFVGHVDVRYVSDRDEQALVQHTCVVDTTLPDAVEVMYVMK